MRINKWEGREDKNGEDEKKNEIENNKKSKT